MCLLSHQRNIVAFCHDLYYCDILPWSTLQSILLVFSQSASHVLVAYYKQGHKNVNVHHRNGKLQHARRSAGGILCQSLGNDYEGAMRPMSTVPCIYLIFSPWFRHRYVGSTKCFTRRVTQHFQKSTRQGKQDLQHVHKVMKKLGVENFCIMPIITTNVTVLRRVERLLIRRLQPTLNVSGTIAERKRRQVALPWSTTHNDGVKLSFFASRLRTAYTHVMLTSLGLAMPRSIGRQCAERLAALVGLENLQRLPEHHQQQNAGNYQCCLLHRPPSSTKVHTSTTFGLQVLRVTTPYGTVDTDNLIADWPTLLNECPTKQLMWGFCATVCIVELVDNGYNALRNSDYRDISRKIWSPLVIVTYSKSPSCILPLSTALRHLTGGSATFVTTVFTTLALRADIDDILTMYELGKQPRSVHWTLRRHNFEQVLLLWRRSSRIKSRPWRLSTQSLIRNHMRSRWGYSPQARVTIRVPCTTVREAKSLILNFIANVLDVLPLCQVGKYHFAENKSVIIGAAVSVAATLCNNIKFSKKSSKVPPECTCATLEAILGTGEPAVGAHVGIRGSCCSIDPFAKIFDISSNSALHPTYQDMDVYTFEIVTAVFKAIALWKGDAYQKLQSDDFDIGTWVGTGQGLFPSWIGTSYVHEIVEAALLAGCTPGLDLWGWILQMKNDLCRRLKPPPQFFPTAFDLMQVNRSLSKVAIISTIDRNPGCLFIQCRKGYWINLQEQYVHSKNYEAVPQALTSDDVISIWKRQGEEAGIPGRFDRKGTVPYCYINPKNKDVQRFRPIVSFAQAPHRSQLNLCARALHFVLQQLPRSHFTLWNAWDARKAILEAQETLASATFADDTCSIRAVVADVKDMYTALPHQHIVMSVAWALKNFTSTTRRDRVNVARRGKPDGSTGPIYDNAARVEIRISCLFDYVSCILKSCYFTCGDQLLQQTIGVPMGNHLSPALAIGACMFCEARYTQSMVVDRPLIGLRYMDDILYMTLIRQMTTNALQREEEENAECMINEAKSIYPESLRVLTTGSNQPLEYLELLLGWNGMTPVFQYADRSTRKRFRDGRSFATRASLVSLVQCMLRRGTQFPSTTSLKLQACVQLTAEFLKLHYPLKVVKDAVYRLKRREQEDKDVWTSLTNLL